MLSRCRAEQQQPQEDGSSGGGPAAQAGRQRRGGAPACCGGGRRGRRREGAAGCLLRWAQAVGHRGPHNPQLPGAGAIDPGEQSWDITSRLAGRSRVLADRKLGAAMRPCVGLAPVCVLGAGTPIRRPTRASAWLPRSAGKAGPPAGWAGRHMHACTLAPPGRRRPTPSRLQQGAATCPDSALCLRSAAYGMASATLPAWVPPVDLLPCVPPPPVAFAPARPSRHRRLGWGAPVFSWSREANNDMLPAAPAPPPPLPCRAATGGECFWLQRGTPHRPARKRVRAQHAAPGPAVSRWRRHGGQRGKLCAPLRRQPARQQQRLSTHVPCRCAATPPPMPKCLFQLLVHVLPALALACMLLQSPLGTEGPGRQSPAHSCPVKHLLYPHDRVTRQAHLLMKIQEVTLSTRS